MTSLLDAVKSCCCFKRASKDKDDINGSEERICRWNDEDNYNDSRLERRPLLQNESAHAGRYLLNGNQRFDHINHNFGTIGFASNGYVPFERNGYSSHTSLLEKRNVRFKTPSRKFCVENSFKDSGMGESCKDDEETQFRQIIEEAATNMIDTQVHSYTLNPFEVQERTRWYTECLHAAPPNLLKNQPTDPLKLVTQFPWFGKNCVARVGYDHLTQEDIDLMETSTSELVEIVGSIRVPKHYESLVMPFPSQDISLE